MMSNFFNLDTNIILRISGLPRLNVLRKVFFGIFSRKKINFITSPSAETRKKLIRLGIFEKKKLHLLRDPILEKNICCQKILEITIKEKNF